MNYYRHIPEFHYGTLNFYFFLGHNGKILQGQPQIPPPVEDEDDSSDEDEDEVGQRDGTLQVNDPVPKPLRDLQRQGPKRPLPPTPDDDGSGDTMRRNAAG